MKNKIICLVLSLVFVVGVFAVNGTYAWFPSYGEGAGGVLHNFKSGNIGYTLVGDFKDITEKIVPKDELLAELSDDLKLEGLSEGTKLYLVGTSTVDTQVRLKLFYTYIDSSGTKADGDSFVSTTDLSESGAPFVAELAVDANEKSYWKYNDTDNYFYYDDPLTKDDETTVDVNEDINVIKAVTQENAQSIIPLFSSMYYSGKNSDLPTSAFGDNVFNVKIVFQAKQANFAKWTDIGEIEFTTKETA